MNIRCIGVDFGTSTSVVAYMDYELDPSGSSLKPLTPYPTLVQFDTTSYSPTAVQLAGSINGKSSDEKYGWKALNNTPFNALLRQNFKMELPILEKHQEAMALTEKFFRYLYETYSAAALNTPGAAPDQIITRVGYPAKWSDTLRAITLNAAKKAGFPNISSSDEAAAAMQFMLFFDSATKKNLLEKYSGKHIHVMTLDMGAGTTDVAVYRYSLSGDQDHQLLASYPKDGVINFGGREVDALLCNFYKKQLGDGLVPALGRGNVELGEIELRNVVKPFKENTLSPQLAEQLEVFAEPSALTYYAYSNPNAGDRTLDRSRFEEITGGYLPLLPKLVHGALREAGLPGSAIDLVMLTGGHSQWYFVEEMLRGAIYPGCDVIDLPAIRNDAWRLFKPADAQHVVAKGLAMLGIQQKKTEQRHDGQKIGTRIDKRYLHGLAYLEGPATSYDGMDVFIGRHGIYEMKANGEKLSRILRTQGNVFEFFFYKDWIYYFDTSHCLKRTQMINDAKIDTVLQEMKYLDSISIWDDKVYYSRPNTRLSFIVNHTVYSINPDTKKATRLFEDYVAKLLAAKEGIYILTKDGIVNQTSSLRLYSFDSKLIRTLHTVDFFADEFFYNDGICYINGKEKGLKLVSIDASGKKNYLNEISSAYKILNLKVYGEWVYYAEEYDKASYHIMRSKLGSNIAEQIVKCNNKAFSVVDDWMYFYGWNNLFRVNVNDKQTENKMYEES